MKKTASSIVKSAGSTVKPVECAATFAVSTGIITAITGIACITTLPAKTITRPKVRAKF